MDSSYKFEIEKFDGSNDFELWKVKMLAHLGNMGLAKALEGEAKLPTTMNSAKKEEVLEKAFNTLILSLGDDVLRKVIKCKTAAEIWSKLESIYMTKCPDKLSLKTEFFTFKMTEGKELMEHLDDFFKLVTKLKIIGVEYDEEEQVLILLRSFPKEYGLHVNDVIQNRESLTLEHFYEALRSKLMALVQPKKRDNVKKSLVTCYNCGEEGHKRKDCLNQRSEPESPDGLCPSAWIDTDGWDDNLWVMSTACTFHMTPNRSLFETYKKVSTGKVTGLNGDSIKVAGIGNVRVKLHDGAERILTKVRHVPGLARNFISLITLGGVSTFDRDGLTVTKGSKLVAKGEEKYGVYVLQGSAVIGGAAPYTSLECI